MHRRRALLAVLALLAAAPAAHSADAWPSLAALGIFVCVIAALAIARYQRTLD